MFIVVVGCGRMGSILAQDFSKEGHNVAVIDKCRERLDSLGSGFNGVVVEGTGIDEETLIKAGIREADVFLAVSQEDNINIMAAQIAKNVFHVPRVMARNYKLELNEFYKKLGLHTIYPLQNVVELIKSKILYDAWEIVGQVGEGDFICIQYQVPIAMHGMLVGVFEEKYQSKVLQIQEGSKKQYPYNHSPLKEGDKVIIAVARENLQILKSIEMQGDRW